MIFKEYKKLNLSKISDEILFYWKNQDIFKKSLEQSKDKNPFIFFEGPPSANGLPGIHHVLARSIKDIFLSEIYKYFLLSNLFFLVRSFGIAK